MQNKPAELDDVSYLTEQAKEYLFSQTPPPEWDKVSHLVETLDIKFISYLSEDYPYLLKTIPDPPIWLFYRGTLKESDFIRSLGVVGTRKPSAYGRSQCQKICSELVRQEITIISGLAFGIDATAHNAAVQNNGRTIAVLGTGVDQIYPPAHKKLAEQIIENGALVSEYLPGSKIYFWNFPNRNRIISGLSQGTWVVEGGEKSGALITAQNAKDQMKPVFCLPADINRESAQGSNKLLQGDAFCVLNAQDIIKGLGLRERSSNQPNSQIEKLNELEKKIYQILLNENKETAFDKLMILSRMSVGELSTIILSLELKGFAQKTAGNKIYPIK